MGRETLIELMAKQEQRRVVKEYTLLRAIKGWDIVESCEPQNHERISAMLKLFEIRQHRITALGCGDIFSCTKNAGRCFIFLQYRAGESI